MIIPTDDSLLNILETPTENKDSRDISPEPNKNDFEPEVKNEPVFINENIENNLDENKILSLNECKLNADAIVDLVDGVAVSTFPMLYKKRLLGSNQNYLEAKELADKLRIDKNATITEDELKIIKKLENYNEYRSLIELQDDEKELIAKPLSQVLYKHQKQASPETMLMIAVGTVYLPKLLPIILAK